MQTKYFAAFTLYVAFLLLLPLSAQNYIKFKLSDYQPPVFDRYELTFSPNILLRGSLQNDETMMLEPSFELSNAKSYSNPSNSGQLNTRYTLKRHRNSYETTTSCSSQISGSLISDKKGNSFSHHYDSSSSNGHSASANIYVTNNTTYYVGKPIFIGLSTTFGYKYDKREHSREVIQFSSRFSPSTYDYSSSDQLSNSQKPEISLDAYIGLGGIKDVTAAVVAENIINQIKAIQKTRARIDIDGVQHLAANIDKMRSGRIFDDREYRKSCVDSIITYLQKNQVYDSLGASAILEIVDLWDHNLNYIRNAGKEIKLIPHAYFSSNRYNRSTSSYYHYDTSLTTSYGSLFEPGRQNKKLYSETLHKGKSEYYEYGAKCLIHFSNPVSKYLQLGLIAEGQLFLKTENYKSNSSSELGSFEIGKTWPEGKAKLSIEADWYPSIRSRISLKPELKYSHEMDYIKRVSSDTSYPYLNSNDNRIVTLALFGSASVYISPKLRYNIDFLFDNSITKNRFEYAYPVYRLDRNMQKTNYTSYELSANLTYDIF